MHEGMTALCAWLAFLFLAWAGLLFGGQAARSAGADAATTPASPRPRVPASPRSRMRLASSLVLVIAAWSWLVAAWPTAARGYALLIAAGMTLGFVGDLFMAGAIPVKQNVLGGMAAFGAGHVAYIAAAVGQLTGGRWQATGWPLAWAAWLAVGVLGWYWAVWRGAGVGDAERRAPPVVPPAAAGGTGAGGDAGRRAAPVVPPAAAGGTGAGGDAGEPSPYTPLHWAALVYALLLSSTAGAATSLALRAAAFAPFAVGAALFLFSDLLIAAGMFGRRQLQFQDSLIWLTYGPGQMLIVSSVGAALGCCGFTTA